MEDGNNSGGSTAKKLKQRRKRKDYLVDKDGQVGEREKLAKRILLSLTRPSYVLGLGPKPLRVEHRARLRYLLRRLVNQHHWVAASGVLSAYLKGTLDDASPYTNRLKFWVLLELLKRVENHSINPTRIKNLYDIWSKKIGSMKTWPVESRYAVHMEFMLFCLLQGNAEDAYQLALCLGQEKGDIGPMSKMMMGLTFYELWYSSIPKEFQWRNSDQFDSQENSDMEGTSFNNETVQSEMYNSVESHMADSQSQRDSDASVMNDMKISGDVVFNEDMEVDANKREKPYQNVQPEGFYLNSEEHKGFGDPFSNNGGLTQDILYGLGGLDSWLLPLRFSDDHSFEEFMYWQGNQPNDFYKNAVKYLQLALDSEPSASAALLPLIQLLLIGGQVDEALNMLEKQCCNSASVLPIRVRAALLERFDRNNSPLLLSCFEDILKKDPTCSDALAKLIKMHQNGDYSLESLLEMIALHLDATHAEYNTWKVFSSCFLRLSSYEEDCMSSCPVQNEDGHKQHFSLNKTPKIFTDGISGKSWRLRCRWWLTRHFSNSKLESEIEAGDLQLLTYKAACASYMYGREFSYVAKAYSHLEQENDKELLLFLDEHRGNSFGFYKKTQKKFTHIT
ncbi:hypothetical protein GLYMA_13G272600v4 [Glycine max]|uniref:Uncharacterized protein n=1 Tax=Glycine max TaxID=3847 RepID=K7M292_SOYBN|nr:uncharacterized protein LOC100800114 [Glycine max]XP_025980918.1 uncharacterized protein LOC100800114 [Glycine max]KRH22015.1 hypothetical protein GLYMA_13G272600v4 [Glycine max]|eukprot:XP_003541828.1 uncharacterized protein LOC100800114 [Glycine max]